MTKVMSVGNLLILICVVCTVANYISNEHQNFILAGVTTVLRRDIPGTLILLNENAFPILSARTEQDRNEITRAHVAAALWGDGRIIAYSHPLFYINDLPDGGDNVKLLINSVNWCRKNANMKIGVIGGQQLKDALLENGFTATDLSNDNLQDLTFLEQFDALAISLMEGSPDVVRTYVQNGGGLLVATQLTSVDGELESFWGNVLLRETGILYNRYLAHGSKDCENNCFDTSMEQLEDTNAFQIWNDLKKYDWKQPMHRKNIIQMMAILVERLCDGPINETLNDEIKLEVQRILPQIPAVIPTETAPVIDESEKSYIIAHKHWIIVANSVGMTDKMPPHPSATVFPGTVSDPSLIARVARETVEIDGRIRWHSTGLYALPGDEIKIQALNADSSMTDLEIQVGIHTDDIEKAPFFNDWKRSPYIVFTNKIKNSTATIANPFGGPIVIVTKNVRDISLKFAIEGSIRAPTYILGETNVERWQNEIRNYPAPWGELIGRNLIISTKSSVLSQLNDPTELMELWDRIITAIEEVMALENEKEWPFWPERIVVDVQIDFGWMHSDYPIAHQLDTVTHDTNLTKIKEDPWIIFPFLHELFHNQQKEDWTFDGNKEVTNNVMALYIMNTIFELPTNCSPAYNANMDLSDAAVAYRLKTYVGNGKQFSKWKSEISLAIDFYVQLQETFGWSAYTNVFSNYLKLSEKERPQNDQEKIDMWMVMFSKTVKEDLSEFFISWGIPISTEAKDLVSHLPPTSLRIHAI